MLVLTENIKFFKSSNTDSEGGTISATEIANATLENLFDAALSADGKYSGITEAGDVVVAQPTTADVAIRKIGFGNTADELFFCPSPDYITHT